METSSPPGSGEARVEHCDSSSKESVVGSCCERPLGHRSAGAYRLAIAVSAAGHTRLDKPVEIELDLAAPVYLGAQGELAADTIRVVEVDKHGKVTDPAVDFQFDQEPDHGPHVPARAALVFLMRGVTTSGAVRHFEVRLDGERAPVPAVAPAMLVVEASDYQGQDSFRIETESAVYYYHKAGGGFASMFDRYGRDWISFRPGDGPRGEYRGIPNAINPEGGFHPGSDMCVSRLLSQGPIRTRIASETRDGKWACIWDIYPQYARLTMLRAGHPYWVLYEGTPAGKLDEDNQYWVRSDGERGPASSAWEQPLPGLGWVYFGESQGLDRVIYLVRHEADGHMDSYWPMQSAMTVFGFGRDNVDRARWCNLARVPARFTIGFAQGACANDVRGVILSAAQELCVSVSTPEAVLGRSSRPSLAPPSE